MTGRHSTSGRGRLATMTEDAPDVQVTQLTVCTVTIDGEPHVRMSVPGHERTWPVTRALLRDEPLLRAWMDDRIGLLFDEAGLRRTGGAA